MKIKIEHILFSIFILIFTFPGIDPIIVPQLDTSYLLAYNYLLVHNVDFLQYLTFTFGPLAFIKHPLPIGDNLAWGIFLQALLQFFFIFFALRFSNKNTKNKTFSFLIVFFFTALLSFDYYFYGLLLLLLFSYRNKKNLSYLVWAAFLVAIAVLIKVNIGLICILIFGSFMLIDLFQNKKYLPFVTSVAFTLVFFLLMYLFVYGNFAYLFRYINSWLVLTLENSSSLTLNPDNNWYLVLGSVLLLLLVPIFQKDKITWIFFGTIILAYYANIKYAFAREDTFHVQVLFDFLLLMIFILMLVIKKAKPITLILMMLSLFFFYENSLSLSTTEEVKKNIFAGFHNFNSEVIYFNEFQNQAIDSSLVCTADKELPKSVLNLIKGQSIDFYPWECSFVIANKLNYKPRPMLQSGSLPEKIDRLNADFISSDEAADFMLWEFNEEGRLASYDDRYQLNSEGQYLEAFFNNYALIFKNEDFALFKNTSDSILNSPKVILQKQYLFNEWIDIPAHEMGVLKIKFEIGKTGLGKLVNAFYKDAAYFIEYKLDNGSIIKHRFAPANAQSGLWVTPYLTDLNTTLAGYPVQQIRLTYEEEGGIVKEEIELNWLLSTFKKQMQSKNADWFDEEKVLFDVLNGFEEIHPQWKYGRMTFDSSKAFSGDDSFLLDSANVYSPTFTFKPSQFLDTVNAMLIIDFVSNFDSAAKPYLVLEHKNDSARLSYFSKAINADFNVAGTWNNTRYTKIVQPTSDTSEHFKIYFWNSRKKGKINIDDVRIRLLRF
jgi:hypothetical protein